MSKEFLERLEKESDTGWRAARTIRDLEEKNSKLYKEQFDLLSALHPLLGKNPYGNSLHGNSSEQTLNNVKRLVNVIVNKMDDLEKKSTKDVK